MKSTVIAFLVFLTALQSFTQNENFVEQALSAFKKEHYPKAIRIMEQALEKTPDNAEIYYYLGFFNHYQAYDSRPLAGYDDAYSGKVFEYLGKAIKLDPNNGNTKYFYGAECSANAFIAMQQRDSSKLKHFYTKAYEKGAYPPWLLEFGKNLLSSCDSNAILFAGGNADFDVCSYLQLHQGFRKDITILPIGNIDRPWYIKFIKTGLPGCVRKLDIALTDEQIMDMHPYKWDTASVTIPFPKTYRKEFQLGRSYQMEWEVAPDLASNRTHTKIEGERTKMRSYLSPQRAMLMHIVEQNYQKRPIYFSVLADAFFLGGLDKFFRNAGLVYELLSIKTKGTKYESDYTKMESMLRDEHLHQYQTITGTNIPRISSLVYNYYKMFIRLAAYYAAQEETHKMSMLLEAYKENLNVGFNKSFEKRVELLLIGYYDSCQ